MLLSRVVTCYLALLALPTPPEGASISVVTFNGRPFVIVSVDVTCQRAVGVASATRLSTTECMSVHVVTLQLWVSRGSMFCSNGFWNPWRRTRGVGS